MRIRLLLGMLVMIWTAIPAGGSRAAEPSSTSAIEGYARIVAAEADLVGWWRFEGDLADAQGKADGGSPRGQPEFVPGAGGGRALDLSDGRFVTMGPTPHLDLEQTTVELWVRPRFASGLGYNPAIVAKRASGNHGQTRFSLHFWGDYSSLAVWNGRAVTRFYPDEPVRADQWYHLALVCEGPKMRLYVDGVACRAEPEGGSFNFAQRNRPLSVGSSTPDGQEQLDASIDELAVYGRALSEEQIARHVDALGRRQRRLELVEARTRRLAQQKRLRAQREARRRQRRAELLDSPALSTPGRQAVYRGEHLEAIRLTLGGIGTGSIQIDGHGNLAAWQIFNNYQPAKVPHSFLAVRVQTVEGAPVVRTLGTDPVGPFAAMKSLTFRGEYPFGWYTLEDPQVPLVIRLEVFNPLVPLDVDASSIPCAIFNLSAENPTDKPVEVAFLAVQQNAVGYRGEGPIEGRNHPAYGGNENRILASPGGKGTVLRMTSTKPAKGAGAGDMVLAILAPEATGSADVESLERLAADFSGSGRFAKTPPRAGPSPAGSTLDGALSVGFRLAPGQRRTVPVVLAWYFPSAAHGSGGWGGPGNHYATLWTDALDVARHVEQHFDELSARTRLYHDTLYQSNLPHWLLDRVASQVAVLRSQTCFWTAEDYFGGWEGCCPKSGCCSGNCSHVWHYAQAHARLFPSIARRMRAEEFRCQAADGSIPFRQPQGKPAFDGQCGTVLNSYREHLDSADGAWLDANWPAIRKAMEFLIARWDADEDGVPGGPQWNTLDGALGGSSSWLGSLYLAALAAAEKMATIERETDVAARYAAILAAGKKTQNETLFNGEYYIQIPGPEPREDYGNGCHIDQVLGQWWACQLDLGWVYPRDRVRTALASLFARNFRGEMEGLPQVPRKFVADFDPGMQMITWSAGPRPPHPIRYGDEVMTGFEYSAAAAMIQAGLLREGLCVARAVSIRYDGRLRTGLTPSRTASWGYSGNPFGDDECGKYYARAMSVWSLLTACQGFLYDGPAGRIGFKPLWQPQDHASFFTTAEGWGLFQQRREEDLQTERLAVRAGRLPVRRLVFQLPPDRVLDRAEVSYQGQDCPAAVSAESGDSEEVRIELGTPVVVGAGEALLLKLHHRSASP